MKRLIIQTKLFSSDLDQLIAAKKLLLTDYEDLEKMLSNQPDLGDVIQGTGGLRKIRLKSSSKGKRGGFRVCYFDGKNEQENISKEDRELFKKLITKIKKS